MPEQRLIIQLPTPFGAACALGILRAVPMPTCTNWRGPVEVVQVDGPAGGIKEQAMDVMAESRRRGMDVPFSEFAWLCTVRGAVCRAELAGCTPCEWLPDCQHLGLCAGLRPHRWAWLLTAPGPVQAPLPLSQPLELRA